MHHDEQDRGDQEREDREAELAQGRPHVGGLRVGCRRARAAPRGGGDQHPADHPAHVEDDRHRVRDQEQEVAEVGDEPAGHPGREAEAECGAVAAYREDAEHQGEEHGVGHGVAGKDGAGGRRHRGVGDDAVDGDAPQHQDADDDDGEGVDGRVDVDAAHVLAARQDDHQHRGAQPEVAGVVGDVGQRHVGLEAGPGVGQPDQVPERGGRDPAADEHRDQLRAGGPPRAQPRHQGAGEDRDQVRRVRERTRRPHEVRDDQHRCCRPQEHDRQGRAYWTHWGHLPSGERLDVGRPGRGRFRKTRLDPTGDDGA